MKVGKAVKAMKVETFPVFVALGSNLGDRRSHFDRAIELLQRTEGFDVMQVAEPCESEPMYVADQPSFLNTALVGRCSVSPRDLLTSLKTIETQVGRRKTFTNGPRVVDLDIVYFGDEVLQSDGLEIPHPRRLERDFVLRPIAALAPDFIDPVTRRSVAEHLRDLVGNSG